MQETSSENCTLICQPLQSLQEFEVEYTKKYAQLILNFFWVVYYKIHYKNIPILIFNDSIYTNGQKKGFTVYISNYSIVKLKHSIFLT